MQGGIYRHGLLVHNITERQNKLVTCVFDLSSVGYPSRCGSSVFNPMHTNVALEYKLIVIAEIKLLCSLGGNYQHNIIVRTYVKTYTFYRLLGL